MLGGVPTMSSSNPELEVAGTPEHDDAGAAVCRVLECPVMKSSPGSSDTYRLVAPKGLVDLLDGLD